MELPEGFVGTVRQELLDHVIVLDEQHLCRLLKSFIGYCAGHPGAAHLPKHPSGDGCE